MAVKEKEVYKEFFSIELQAVLIGDEGEALSKGHYCISDIGNDLAFYHALIVLLAQVGSGTPNVGQGYLLPVFAAVFLGATQVKPGRFNVWGTILAIYLLATGVQGLQLAGGQYWVNDAFNGAALLIAWATILGHALRVARANPIRALRYE